MLTKESCKCQQTVEQNVIADIRSEKSQQKLINSIIDVTHIKSYNMNDV